MDVEKTILKLASQRKKFKTADVVERLEDNISRQFVSRVINELVKQGKLAKSGSTRSASYALPEKAAFLGNRVKKRILNNRIKEHEVFDDLIRQAVFLKGLKRNVLNSFAYAFSEMLNNAIEHSGSKNIEVEIEKRGNDLLFVINDFGVGVFKSIMRKNKLSSELEAIQDLLKGKTTTMPQSHSGEGIFFTSKVSNVFILESFGRRLRIDNIINDVFVEELKPSKKGTKVIFRISASSNKNIERFFRKYQTEPKTFAFDKTEVRIKLHSLETIYISRSQARRVLAGLEKFKTVILNFDKVLTIGQGFADEIFRVFKSKHPQIEIKAINTNKSVAFMIARVKK